MFRWRKRVAALTLSFAFILPGVIWLAGALQPDYSHFSHAVSELGAPNAVAPGLMNYAGFVVAGVLMLVYVAAVWPVLGGDVLAVATAVLLTLTGISLVGVGLFHCDPGCPIAGASPTGLIHHLFGTAALLFAALTPWAAAVHRGQLDGYGRFVCFSLVIGAVLLGLFSLSPLAIWAGMAGLQQRLFLFIYLAWLLVYGRFVLQQFNILIQNSRSST